MFDPRSILPDDLIYEEMCGTVLLVLVLIITFAYFRKRSKWDGYVERFGDRLEGDDRAAYLKRMRGLVGRTMFSVIVFLVVLFFGLLITIAFVENYLGKWTWLLLVVFIIGILIVQTYMILSLKKFTDLPEEEYGYIHDIVNRVSENFNEKPPTLKLDESPDINAYTTSVFGSASVVVITKGLLDRVESGRFSENQLQSIVGHELGHIVNNDATITTLLNPIMMFVLMVKGFLELIVKGILFVIIASGKYGIRGVLRFILAIILILFLVWILLYVGIAYVIFYLIALVIVLAGTWVSRQKEYAADLFGSLVMGSRLPLGIGLMNL
ncbi:MAG: M48 family metalloprotease, partial [Thermoplasmata archaeon]|nr:M48 family metalloprotease [Thermoplasmata archaeon]